MKDGEASSGDERGQRSKEERGIYHIVSQRNNNELRILGSFLNVGGDNRYLQGNIR
jgi:hypothetical protein